MKRILSIFLIMLLFCVTKLNGEDRKINEKALRRMIKHMTTIKNLLRNLQLDRDLTEDSSSSESESSGSESSGSDPSGSESSGSEPSGSESSGSEGSGSEGSEGSGSEASEGSESEGSEGSKSEASEGSESEASEGSGSEASEGSESQSLEESESSPSTNSTTPLTANPYFEKHKPRRINILSFSSFRGPFSSSRIEFVVFILFKGSPIGEIIEFILTIRYIRLRGLRYLQEEKNETATCTPVSDKIEGKNIKYSCTSSKDGNSQIEQVAIVDLKIDNQTVRFEDINFSDEALLAASNLQNFTKTIDEMYDLKNGTLKVNPNKYFDIKGDIDDDRYQGKVGEELMLSVVDNSTGQDTIKNASCKIQKVTNKNYELRCTSGELINGYIHLASMYDDNKAINLYMKDEVGSLSYDGRGSDGSPTIRSNPTYKKSSSGLSGGAIAGIVIACAVVLIIASIIAMMLRKPSVPIKNNSSITELRSIDNYTQ
jgi:hypothetical protein